MPTNQATLDDDLGTRDWEGPIPGVTPGHRARESKLALRDRTRSVVGSAMDRLTTEFQARPFMVMGAAFGVGVIAATALRSGAGRALLLALARKLTL